MSCSQPSDNPIDYIVQFDPFVIAGLLLVLRIQRRVRTKASVEQAKSIPRNAVRDNILRMV
jgi:hypothetical protein